MTRRAGVLVAVLALGLAPVLALVGPAGAQSAPATASGTSGCRAVGGGAVDGGGPHRATVVVDTGSGTVWSACVAFDGTIDGIRALELAKAQIPDLDPVYDVYAGEGRAVCQLRGVGNPPPDCLGKSAAYWAYFHDGTYSRRGAGSTTVGDGDVDGWRWGSSTTPPRSATAGYEAVAATPTPTPTTAPRATTTTTRPAAGGGTGGSGSGSGLHVTPGGVPATTTAPDAGSSATTVPSASATTAPRGGAAATTSTTSTSAPGAGSGGQDGSASSAGSRTAARRTERPSEQVAGKALPTIPTVAGSSGGDGSSAGSILGFGLALVSVVGIGAALRVRRRRQPV